MTDLILRGGRPWTPGTSPQPADIHLSDGRIKAIGTGLDAPEADIVDLGGAIVIPGLVDAHCHLDKTMWSGPWVPNTGGRSLAGRIGNGEGRRPELAIPSPDYAANLLGTMISHGTTHVRSHIDIDPEIGLGGVEAVREAASRFDGRVDVELVAFPQGGLLTRHGTAELMEEALKGGVEVVGGLDPAGYDRDPVGQLDVVFGLAERYGAKVDIHLHDPEALGAWEFELIIERTRATGMAGRVTISHAYAMGDLDPDYQRRIAEGLAEAGVSMITCAVADSAMPPVALMHELGANLAAGNDGIRDLWTPYGDGDMLRRVNHIAYRARLVADEEIELALQAATYGGAKALCLESYGIAPGNVADLVAVDGEAPANAIMELAPRNIVVKGGQIVARGGALVE